MRQAGLTKSHPATASVFVVPALKAKVRDFKYQHRVKAERGTKVQEYTDAGGMQCPRYAFNMATLNATINGGTPV